MYHCTSNKLNWVSSEPGWVEICVKFLQKREARRQRRIVSKLWYHHHLAPSIPPGELATGFDPRRRPCSSRLESLHFWTVRRERRRERNREKNGSEKEAHVFPCTVQQSLYLDRRRMKGVVQRKVFLLLASLSGRKREWIGYSFCSFEWEFEACISLLQKSNKSKLFRMFYGGWSCDKRYTVGFNLGYNLGQLLAQKDTFLPLLLKTCSMYDRPRYQETKIEKDAKSWSPVKTIFCLFSRIQLWLPRKVQIIIIFFLDPFFFCVKELWYPFCFLWKKFWRVWVGERDPSSNHFSLLRTKNNFWAPQWNGRKGGGGLLTGAGREGEEGPYSKRHTYTWERGSLVDFADFNMESLCNPAFQWQVYSNGRIGKVFIF